MPHNLLNAIENDPLNKIKLDGLIQAAGLVTKRRFNEAKRVIGKVLKACPHDARIMCILANVHIMDEKYSDAEKWLDKALLIEPENPQALCHMGVVYFVQGKFDDAIEMNQDAIKNFPKQNKHDIAEAYHNLGCSLWEARRKEEALEAWKTCLKYNPSQESAKKNLKDCTNAYGMGKSPVGMDDIWAFVDLKQQEYLSVKGRDSFDDTDDEKAILKKIMDAWNTHIAGKFGATLDRMNSKEKMKVFNEIKVFTK
jgi:tetratricopeptide (TPR) repeat protein